MDRIKATLIHIKPIKTINKLKQKTSHIGMADIAKQLNKTNNVATRFNNTASFHRNFILSGECRFFLLAPLFFLVLVSSFSRVSGSFTRRTAGHQCRRTDAYRCRVVCSVRSIHSTSTRTGR